MADLLERLKAALADRYAIDHEIGRGGMATVYLAEDIKHHRRVAIKVMKPELAAAMGAERFLREIEIAAQLQHPHILPLYDSGEAEGLLYYVMPYVEGKSLRERLLREKQLSVEAAVEVAKSVAVALDHAHRHELIHRDIKPENILFSEGLAVVADFGIAKVVSMASRDALTRSGFPLGTPGYMSPEQATGRTEIDERTDVCGLACVVYEMLIGETPGVWPVPDEVRTGRFAELPPGHRERLDRLPGRVEQILVRALAIRQTQRFDTPTAFADALARASERGEKFDDDKVRDVLDRAAELDAEHAAHDEALSMGGVERVAAEVGISPERVREAAREVATPHTGIVRGGYLGVTGNIELERLVAGRVSRPQYGAMVEGIRQAVGEAGRINETFDESLFWEGRLVTASRRRVQVTVSPVGAESRIRITERIGEDLSASIASGVVGSLFVVLSGIALVVDGNVGLSAVLATIAVGQYTAVRALYHRYVKRRFRSLSALMQRLVQQATGSGARALPEGDHPPFQELVRPKG